MNTENVFEPDQQRCPQCRRVLCPTPNIRRFVENVKGRKLVHVPEGIIEEVVKTWEVYRTCMEAGGGIEPPRSGI